MMPRSVFLLVIGLSLLLTGAASAPRTVSVSGKVLDPQGRPAGGAMIFVSAQDFTRSFDGEDRPPTVRQTTAAADGSFRLEMPVESDRWSLTLAARKAGYGPGIETAWRGKRSTGLALVLSRPSFVAGRVVDADGQPLAGARVRAKWIIPTEFEGGYQLPREALAPRVTDAQGRFRLAPLPATSRVVLSAEHPGYCQPLGASDRVRTGAEDVTISLLPAGTIAGGVIDQDGKPLAKVNVLCLTTGTVIPKATTDAEGRYRFSPLMPGAYLLVPEPTEALAGFESAMQRVVVSAGGESICPDLRLKRLAGSAVLSGKVTDAAGQPVPDVGIRIQRLISGTGMLNMPLSGPTVWTGADGAYRMRLPPGEWRAYATFLPPGYRLGPPPSPPQSLAAAPGTSLTQDFTLAPETAIQGQVLDAGGRPAPGAKLRAWPGRVVTTDIDGYFKLPLYPGPSGTLPRTRLTVLSLDRSQGTVLELQPDEVKGERMLRLRRFPLVTGVVTDDQGAPVPRAEVRAEVLLSNRTPIPDDVTTALGATVTDARGHFSLPLAPGSSCRVTAEAAGFTADRRLVELQTGKPPASLQLSLRRGGGVIAGVVVDPEGRPLPGAQLTSWSAGPDFYSGPALAGAITDREGRFRMERLPPREVNISAWLPGYYQDRRQNVKVGVTHLRLILAPMSQPTAPPVRLSTGARAPEIQVTGWANGPGVPNLAALRGKTVVLQFSSAYNRAAQGSNATLSALWTRLKAAGRDDTVILALYDSAAPAAEVEAYARAEQVPFPIGLLEAGWGGAGESPTVQAYGVRHLPTVFLIDPNGIVRAVDPAREELMKLAAEEPCSSFSSRPPQAR